MSIGYVRAKRMISVGSNPGQKYLAIINRNGNIGINELTKQISQATTISEPDVLACLKAFEIFIGEHILNGMV